MQRWVENVDDCGREEKARSRFRSVVDREEPKVDVVGEEVREARNVANESKSKEEFDDNLRTQKGQVAVVR